MIVQREPSSRAYIPFVTPILYPPPSTLLISWTSSMFPSTLLRVLGNQPDIMGFNRLLGMTRDEFLVRKQMFAGDKSLRDVTSKSREGLPRGFFCRGSVAPLASNKILSSWAVHGTPFMYMLCTTSLTDSVLLVLL